MAHLPFTLAAYFFNALSVLSSKFLLSKTIPDPLIYIFYISLVSLLAVLVLPFTRIPDLATFSLASGSTLLWTLGAYFMFKALKAGQVSRVIPVIGTIIPLILLLVASQTNAVSPTQIWAVLILVLGMIFLTFFDLRGHFHWQEIAFEVLSAIFFALSYLILRSAFVKFDFFSVLIWSRLILIPFVAFMLIFPLLRKKIITSHRLKTNFASKAGLVFIGGQLSGALGELLLVFSISLSVPALVNSLQGTQYVFLLIFALFLSKKYPKIFGEKYTPVIIVSKTAGIGLLGIGLYLLAFTR